MPQSLVMRWPAVKIARRLPRKITVSAVVQRQVQRPLPRPRWQNGFAMPAHPCSPRRGLPQRDNGSIFLLPAALPPPLPCASRMGVIVKPRGNRFAPLHRLMPRPVIQQRANVPGEVKRNSSANLPRRISAASKGKNKPSGYPSSAQVCRMHPFRAGVVLALRRECARLQIAGPRRAAGHATRSLGCMRHTP